MKMVYSGSLEEKQPVRVMCRCVMVTPGVRSVTGTGEPVKQMLCVRSWGSSPMVNQLAHLILSQCSSILNQLYDRVIFLSFQLV